MIDSYGVLVKFTINKDEKGERVMREFAKLSQNYAKTDRDKYKLKRIEILSEVVDFEYVNKMGNLCKRNTNLFVLIRNSVVIRFAAFHRTALELMLIQ